jgi:spore maturation protein CgeB
VQAPDALAANLRALRAGTPRHREVARRIEAGGVAAPSSPRPWPALPEASEVLLIGAASPEGIAAALDAGTRIVLWERSAPVLRVLLEGADWSVPLASGRLRLACDVDLLALDVPDSTPVVPHPVLGLRYARELAWRAAPPAGSRQGALLVDGGLLVEELARALEARGDAVWTWETTRLPPAELARIARALRPAWVLAVNHQPGLPEAVEGLQDACPGLSLAVWEIDPATDDVRPPEVPAPHTAIHTWRRANVARFAAAGFRASWLPLASDPTRRRPLALGVEEQAAYGAPVTFVGRSMAEEARRYHAVLVARLAAARVTAGLDPAQAPAILERILAEQRAHPGAYRIPDAVATHAPELLQAVPGDANDAGMLLGEVAAAEFRMGVVANLGRFGAHVWGDAGWQAVERHGVRYRGPAGHTHQLPRIYGNGGIHVDVGRLYQLDIVTLRVFDVLACGGFLLAQHGDDLAEIFVVGEEIESWRTVPELLEKVAWYLPRPEARARIAARGRARVLADHTVAQRVAVMLDPAGSSPVSDRALDAGRAVR